jgi:diguanylate cyclase (GGDEF)-like protein
LSNKDFIFLYQQLSEFSEIDFITNTLNRRGIEKRLGEYINFSSRYKENLSLIKFSPDEFNNIIQTSGPETGNLLLKEISAYISKNIRKTDVFGRVNQEEFLILMRYTQLEVAKKQIEKIRKYLAKTKIAGISLTVSFGITMYHDGESIDKFISRADRAMYRSKFKKNSISVID